MTENTVRVLLQTLTQSFHDTGIVLDDYEATHDEMEAENSRHYAALVAGHFALKDAIERINSQLEKQIKPNKQEK